MKPKMAFLFLGFLCFINADSFRPSIYFPRYQMTSNILHIEAGSLSSFEPFAYVLRNAHTLPEEEYNRFNVKSNVDVQKIGEYQVTYNENLKMQVLVEDTLAPALQLKDLQLKEKADFVWNKETYASIISTLSDNYSTLESLSESLTCDEVDTLRVGNTKVNCHVQDESGNESVAELSIDVQQVNPSTHNSSVMGMSQQPIQIPNANYSGSELAQIQEVASLINQIRVEHGLSSLRLDLGEYHKVTYLRSQEVATSYSHTRPNGSMCYSIYGDYGVGYHSSGENIAQGQQSAQEVVRDWMNSSKHRENILRAEFTILSIGVSGSGTSKVWVQEFFS